MTSMVLSSQVPAVGPTVDLSAGRTSTIRLQSISLGTAGLGGVWQSASPTVSGAPSVSDVLFATSALIWVVLLALWLRRGGGRLSHLQEHVRHPAEGFALAFVPITGMLIAGHFAPVAPLPARAAYLAFGIISALVAARLLAHWIDGALRSTALHPGYLLPVVSGPFVASIGASAVSLPNLAWAAFAIGLLYWLSFGTVVMSSLVTGDPMPESARPVLAVLCIPPGAGGLAWIAMRQGNIDAVAYGLAGATGFSVLVIAFLLPHLHHVRFHPSLWVLSFPVAVTTNLAIRVVQGAGVPGERVLVGALVAVASLVMGWLASCTALFALRATRKAWRK